MRIDRRTWTVKPPPGTPLITGHSDVPNILAYPFNDGGGPVARNYATSQEVTIPAAGTLNPSGGSTGSWGQGKNGSLLSCTSGGEPIVVGSLNGAFSASITIMFGQRKRVPGTFIASAAFGLASNAQNMDILCPFSDGTVYWDYQNTSSGRISIGSLTFGDDVWAFTAGPRGQEIWQNGRLVQSQGTSQVFTGGDSLMYLGSDPKDGQNSDNVDFDFLYVWNRQVSQSVIQELTVRPFSVFSAHRPRVFGFGFASQNIQPSGLASGFVAGTPSISASIIVSPSGLPSGFVSGNATIAGPPQRVFPSGVPSGFKSGTPTVVGGANPGVSLYIGGVLFPILVEGANDPIPGAGSATKPTFSSQTIGRWTFQCDVFSQNNQFVPKVGQTVQLFDFGSRRFMGCLNNVVSELLTGSQSYQNGVVLESGQVIHHITCLDKSSILDHRVVNAVYVSGSDVATAVRDILFNWCAGEGITCNTLPLTLTTLDSDEQFYFVPASQALDKLATDCACVWWVDQQGDLHFVPIVSLPPCPYQINTATISGSNPAVRAISVQTTLTDYRNYEIVTSNLSLLPGSGSGPISITESYTLPQAAAQSAGYYLGVIVTQFPIGQITSLIVNGVAQPTYLGSAGYNFRHAWWYFPGAPFLYAPNATNDVPALPDPPVTSPDPSIGQVVSITYVPWAPKGSPIGVVPTAGIATGSPLSVPGGTCGTGIFQVVDQVKNVNLLSDANAIAAAILARSGGVPKFLQFETDLPNAQVGQQILANVPELNISFADSFMITSIQATDWGGNLGYGTAFRSVITAQTGQDFGNQIKWFERLVARTENAQPVLQYELASFFLGTGSSVSPGTNVTNSIPVRRSGRLTALKIVANVAPVGQNLIIDILDNGVSIFGSPKPQLLAGQTFASFTGPFSNGAATFVFTDDILTINVSYGVTSPGTTAQAGPTTASLQWAV